MSSSQAVRSSKYSYRATSTGPGADVNIETSYITDMSSLSRLEDKIRLLQDDLEVERELRQRIEREKADLSVQVIQMSERLEEAEGGAEHQFEANRKRDAELLKLRKMLEDVHLESEETSMLLKKKHNEIITDFQEQVEILTKNKARAEKDKAKFQSEVYELLSQIESYNKEKIVSEKHISKLEISISELNVKIEELNRTVIDITSHKSRLSQENIELIKDVQDLKSQLDVVSFSKSQVISQLEDARRRLEDEDRRRSMLESSLHQVEIELDSTRSQLEEESEARIDLERQLVKANADAASWQNKWNAEVAARAEEVEEIRRKYQVRITELEEHIETLIVKVNNLEKMKTRLASEVEVLIIDLEKSNNSCRELQKSVNTLEKHNVELKSRLEETILLYETSQRDLKNKHADLVRTMHEMDKVKDANGQLARENKKLGDDLHEAKSAINELNRRLHEMELELRRLENEREELTAAYKEAEAGRKAEEQRGQRLAADFNQYRHDAERRMHEKDEEIEAIRERGLKQYRSSNTVRQYNADEIVRLSRTCAARADEILSSFRAQKRTPFSVQKLVDATRLTKHIEPDTVVERSRQRRRRRQEELEDLIKRDTLKILQRIRKIEIDNEVDQMSDDFKRSIRGKSASAIAQMLLSESERNIQNAKKEEENFISQSLVRSSRAVSRVRSRSSSPYEGSSSGQLRAHAIHMELMDERLVDKLDHRVSSSLHNVKRQLSTLNQRTVEFYADSSKQTSIEIEQLNARVIEAETRLKTEVTRIKKKLQIQITELEMSLDVANKTNIDLQKVIKKQSLQLTELQAHYEDVQRQLQATLDQYGVAQRRLAGLNGELDEMRSHLDSANRAKRTVELQYEEAQTRINELTTVNVNLVSLKSKLEQELTVVASDYEEVSKELRISDERYQKVSVDLKHVVEQVHEEQERIVKLETIKKSLEVEVKNLSVRLEEVELNAVAGSKRIISKLEARIRDLELELEEEKRRHAETIKILRKKERTVKEVMVQCEEDQKNIILLQDALDKTTAKINIYRRQLSEQEGFSQQSTTRVRRFQRELEAAEDRADVAESNLNIIRAKHRTFVTTSTVPGSQVYIQETTRTITE
ncbi:Prm [Drosophila busckii]|uniref:Prm n=1 Tax=Drosophila busckii TaxID=30019 RepID=A0A0M4EBM3_DROBS|nr:Prm [Drosophila busckii]